MEIENNMNQTEISTRMPSKVRTYQNTEYLLTETEKIVIIIIFCTVMGIIVITGTFFVSNKLTFSGI